MDSKLKVLNPR